MTGLRMLFFEATGCPPAAGEIDALGLFRLLADEGLVPGIGPWSSAQTPRPLADSELAAYVDLLHRVTDGGERQRAGRRVAPLVYTDIWGCGLVRREAPRWHALGDVSRLAGGTWEVSVQAGLWQHRVLVSESVVK